MGVPAYFDHLHSWWREGNIATFKCVMGARAMQLDFRDLLVEDVLLVVPGDTADNLELV